MTDRIREFLRTRREDGPCVVIDTDVGQGVRDADGLAQRQRRRHESVAVEARQLLLQPLPVGLQETLAGHQAGAQRHRAVAAAAGVAANPFHRQFFAADHRRVAGPGPGRVASAGNPVAPAARREKRAGIGRGHRRHLRAGHELVPAGKEVSTRAGAPRAGPLPDNFPQTAYNRGLRFTRDRRLDGPATSLPGW